ncbi:MAG: hypothetical protein IH616_03260 [Gemmatimonadales bacterium]|nr:hypothetical protein [Gemmatimonadales bacterium]
MPISLAISVMESGSLCAARHSSTSRPLFKPDLGRFLFGFVELVSVIDEFYIDGQNRPRLLCVPEVPP